MDGGVSVRGLCRAPCPGGWHAATPPVSPFQLECYRGGGRPAGSRERLRGRVRAAPWIPCPAQSPSSCVKSQWKLQVAMEVRLATAQWMFRVQIYSSNLESVPAHCQALRKVLNLPDFRFRNRWQCSRKRYQEFKQIRNRFLGWWKYKFPICLIKHSKKEQQQKNQTFTDVMVLLSAWEPGRVQMTQWSNLSLQKDWILAVSDLCVNPSTLHHSLFPLQAKFVPRISNLS